MIEVWIAVLVGAGALLFFAAGYFTARAGRPDWPAALALDRPGPFAAAPDADVADVPTEVVHAELLQHLLFAEADARPTTAVANHGGALAAAATVTPALSGGKALQALVEDLATRGAIRAVVIADELGLVVAAAGEQADEMAAAGVVIARAGAQARQLLPVGKLRRIVVEDEDDVALTVRPLDLEDGTLCLVTLADDAPHQAAAGAPRGATWNQEVR
jgi:predicted regulator of Ras-like GTPase activity (Roadblock/LC7/MglB family)